MFGPWNEGDVCQIADGTGQQAETHLLPEPCQETDEIL